MLVLLRAAIGAAIAYAGKALALLLALWAAKRSGAEEQAAQQNAAALKTETAIAKAEAQAPATVDEVAERANERTF